MFWRIELYLWFLFYVGHLVLFIKKDWKISDPKNNRYNNYLIETHYFKIFSLVCPLLCIEGNYLLNRAIFMVIVVVSTELDALSLAIRYLILLVKSVEWDIVRNKNWVLYCSKTDIRSEAYWMPLWFLDNGLVKRVEHFMRVLKWWYFFLVDKIITLPIYLEMLLM